MEDAVVHMNAIFQYLTDQVSSLSKAQLTGLIPMLGGLLVVFMAGGMAKRCAPKDSAPDVKLMIKFIGLALCLLGALMVLGILPPQI